MQAIKITILKQTVYQDLIDRYENPLDEACFMRVGDSYVSIDAKRPANFCESAWSTMLPFVQKLAIGEGNFYDGWMKDPMSAMVSCNDGFRPMTFLLEVV